MIVGIYCRVSTEEQDADKQEDICLEYCKKMGWVVYSVYKDVISGSSTQRRRFNALLQDMRDNKIDCIMVTKLDRLGRSLQHLLSLFDEFKKRHINFIAVTQNIDTTTSSGQLQLQIMGAFAEFEKNLISERTKEGLRRAKEKGTIGKRGKDKNKRKRRYHKKPINYFNGGV